MDGMHNQKLESGENLYGDIQKEKENRDEMEMSDGDGIGGRGSGTRNMTVILLNHTFFKHAHKR